MSRAWTVLLAELPGTPSDVLAAAAVPCRSAQARAAACAAPPDVEPPREEGPIRPQPYGVYVDDRDMVWVTDFQGDGNRILRFNPSTEQFETFTLSRYAQVRQLLGRPGEVWGAESGTNKLVLIRTR